MKSKLGLIYAMASLDNNFYDPFTNSVDKLIKPMKSCKRCGNNHLHNNLYCSAECCKKHRIEQKNK